MYADDPEREDRSNGVTGENMLNTLGGGGFDRGILLIAVTSNAIALMRNASSVMF